MPRRWGRALIAYSTVKPAKATPPLQGRSTLAAITPSPHLKDVRYDIRGHLARRARELEQAGTDILKLNIGNPAHYGFATPEPLRLAVAGHLQDSEGYGHEQGMTEARAAIAEVHRARGSHGVDAEHVFIGNGVSELIDISLRALLRPGDEVLLPSPDYPLWTASTHLNGGKPRYYSCPAERGHLPDPDEIEALIGPATRAIVLINPNNPTGAVYPRALLQQIVEVAARHRLLLLSDEIYDDIRFDDTPMQPLAELCGELPCISFGGLSKVHRACGYRVGWMVLSGAHARTAAYRDALQLLSALRVCPNILAQWAIIPALQGAPTIQALTGPGGRLEATRQAIIEEVRRSDYLQMVSPLGALYAFPSISSQRLPGFDDMAFAVSLLEHEHVLLTPGSSFNLAGSRHLRLTLLPPAGLVATVFERIERALQRCEAEASLRQAVA
ncbi:aspartate/tyrosine/aromatic aminotransferase [Frateuria aurantia DSM 6220]|uniref:alanine transaminase n=1 Tax=Frateuria aurantia (strain ATCC 33424 / DSM 6220 / KCTC 2777 / LMG 1558 / NBRC 3245 / NCIMB 13370) TaxID=767434 RepID=H8KZ13_FRAAD|nr:aspartate/tyrosine/aromatic aminotransferase [Frateuria aurantia DSM 6220]